MFDYVILLFFMLRHCPDLPTPWRLLLDLAQYLGDVIDVMTLTCLLPGDLL